MKILLLLLVSAFLFGCTGRKFLMIQPKNNAAKKVYLTFDDGPNGTATEKILTVLEKHKIKAAFFVIGKNVVKYPEIAKAIVDKGHIIGNHSYGIGTLLAFQSFEAVKSNLEKTNKIILKATGEKPKYFRPPYGLMSNNISKACKELGLIPIEVNIFVNDSFISNPKNIAKKVLKKIQEGEYIIVLHDGFGTYNSKSREIIAETLEIIIKELDSRNFKWATIDNMHNQIKQLYILISYLSVLILFLYHFFYTNEVFDLN